MRWYSRSSSAPETPRNCGPDVLRYPFGSDDRVARAPVIREVDPRRHAKLHRLLSAAAQRRKFRHLALKALRARVRDGTKAGQRHARRTPSPPRPLASWDWECLGPAPQPNQLNCKQHAEDEPQDSFHRGIMIVLPPSKSSSLLDQFPNDSHWAGWRVRVRVRVPHSSRLCLSGSFLKLETRNLKLHNFPTASSTHSHSARRCVSSAEKCPASIHRSVLPFQ